MVEGGSRGDRLGRLFDGCMLVVIFSSVAVALLGTDPAIQASYNSVLATVEVAAGVIFVVEYLLRVWVCTEDRRNRYSHPLRGRLR